MKKKLTALLCAVFLVATFGFGQVRDKWLTKPFTEILELNKQLLVKELSSAPSHTSGWGTFYVLSSDGLAYFKDASGNAYDLTAAASGAPDSAHYLTDQVEAGLSAEVVVTANGKSLVTAANYAAMRTLLDLEPGVDYQAYNTVLTELTALTDPGADSFPFWNDTTNNYEWSTVIFPIAGGIAVGASGNAGKYEWEDADGDVLGISVGVQAGNTDYVWPTAFPAASGYAMTSSDAGVLGWDSDVTDLITAATTGAAGKSELATTAEVNAGVDTTRSVTADALAGSTIGRKTMIWKCTAPDEVVVDADNLDSIKTPADSATWLVVDVDARVITVDDGADDIVIDIYNATSGQDVLSTAMTIDGGDASEGGTTPFVIDAAQDDITAGDILQIDVTTYAGDNAAGLEVHITLEKVT